MAPVAGHLSLGTGPTQLGRPLPRLEQLDWPTPSVQPGRVTGSVVAIDSFGNGVTDIDATSVPAKHSWSGVQVRYEDIKIVGLISTYAEREPGAVVALFGSNARLELAVVNGNAARQLGIQIGDQIVVRWTE